MLQNFLSTHSIYDVMPMNGQVLVFNTNLTLNDAINTLADQNIFCAVLWDEIKRKFIDLFTIRDILNILAYLTEQLNVQYPGKVHTLSDNDQKLIKDFLGTLNPRDIKKFVQPERETKELTEEYEYKFLLPVLKMLKLKDWVKFVNQIPEYKPEILITKSLKDSLLDACKEMTSKKIHRLAVIEESDKGTNLCGIITHDMIMGYIISNMQGDSSIFEVPIQELSLETKKLITATSDMKLLQILECLRENKISFLPIVESESGNSYTIGFFSLKDLIKLIRERKYHMVFSNILIDGSSNKRSFKVDSRRRGN